MALVSPGVKLTVTDESSYASSAIGTVPLVFLATAQNKLTPSGTLAVGTTKENAGKLQVFTSQRDLINAFGNPAFQRSAAGTPLHGNELNEYGLMTAYSSLGVGSQLYAIRADIDLNALQGTSVRPTGEVPDGTYWLDLADTSWGIYEWSASTQSFTEKMPTLITSTTNLTTSNPVVVVNGSSVTLNNEPTPVTTIGSVGNYAVVTTQNPSSLQYNNRVFRKTQQNAWALVGSTAWQNDLPVVTGTIANPTFTGITATPIHINGTSVTVNSASVTTVASSINSSAIPGVSASVINGQLAISVNSLAAGNTGILTLQDNASSATTSLLVQAGIITAGQWTDGIAYNQDYTFAAPTIQYSNYAGIPPWTTNPGDTPQPNGAVWFKAGALGGGSNFVVKKYNATTGQWTKQAVEVAASEEQAIYDMDIGGGSQIAHGAVYVYEDPNTYNALTDNLGTGGFTFYERAVPGALSVTGGTPGAIPAGNQTFTLSATTPGSNAFASVTVRVAVATVTGFINAIQNALVNTVLSGYITVSPNANGTITINHLAGGTIKITKDAGQPDYAALAGFTGSVTGVTVVGTVTILSNFSLLSYTASISTPQDDPMDGTYWYYSDPTVVDVMINTGTQWVGYKTLTADARGYNLANTDANGVIVEFTAPTTQSNGTSALVPGDLWLDTSDLENWPKMNRWNGSTWVAIDSTDQIDVNGILFADARWDGALSNVTSGLTNGGTTDPATSIEDPVSALLYSNYLDLDAPNPELYPRGMLLFNTRRSGYNVKRFVSNYFNTMAFDIPVYSSTTTYATGAKVLFGSTVYVANQTTVGNSPIDGIHWSMLNASAWVTSSGLKNDGSPYAGHYAQRQLVVEAMNAAVEANTQIREDQFGFSLIAAPGYPELITNMVGLNNDRSNTAFVIGDTPLSLSTNVVNLNNWSNDTNGDGLPTNDPYLAVYYPSALSTDLGGNTIMVPPSHMALHTYLNNDNLAYPWFAPAGLRRGLVSNATDLGYLDYASGEFMRTGVNQGLRDALYQLNINPITILPGTGIVVWGQKTRDPIVQDMSRVNVSRLVNYIRTLLATATYGFLFEPNDAITRNQAAAVVSNALNDLISKRGIYDYVVVCDTSNNTPSIIQQNQLYIDVAIAPTIAVEFIYIPIRLVNASTGAAGA